MKLTKRICDQSNYPKEKGNKGFHAVWDGELKGFGLRVNPTGKKVFILKYRVNGKQGILSIGEYGKITVDEARAIAKERFADIAKGKDPNEEKKKIAFGGTMKDLANHYLEYSKKEKKSWRHDEKRILNYVLPELGKKKIESVRRADVTILHKKIGEKAPYQANRVLALLSAMFTFALRKGMVDERFINPCKLVEKYKESSRDRFMSEEEWWRLWQALEEEPNIYIKSAILLDLLTGLRKSELLGLKWENLDLSTQGKETLSLSDSKAGRPHRLPLTPEAVELLKGLPRLAGNPYVFPSNVKEGCHIVEIKRTWNRIRKKADLMDVHFHDIRRTAASWLAISGKSLPLIGGVLNQTSQQVTAVYARLSIDPIREALDEQSKKIVDITKIKPAKEKTA